MPDTRQFTHPSFQEGGAARIFVKVPNTALGDTMFELGAATNVAFKISRETQTQEERRHGVEYPRQQRTRKMSGQLTGRFLENINPAISKYLLGLGETQVTAVPTVAVVHETVKFFGEERRILSHPANIAASAPEPDIDEAVSAVFGAGSAIPAGTHSYAVVAWYDAAETVGSFPDTGDQDWMDFIFAAAPNTEYLGLVWDAPAGVTPHHYTVYVQALVAVFNPANPAEKLFETTGTSAVIGTHVTGYPPKTFGAAAAAVFSLKSWNGVTTYILNTDYTFDTGKGEIAAVDGGALVDGVSYVFSYSYNRPARVLTPISLAKARPTYYEVTVLGMEEGEDGYELGKEMTLYKVNLQTAETNLPFPEDGFADAGLDFTWDVLLDGSQSALGHVYDVNTLFTNLDTNY